MKKMMSNLMKDHGAQGADHDHHGDDHDHQAHHWQSDHLERNNFKLWRLEYSIGEIQEIVML